MNFGLQRFDIAPGETEDDPRRDIRIGAGIAVLFFVVLLGWAALTPLEAAVRANGVISVLGNRQAVQHPSGGVVTELRVREGQRVNRGDVLIELAAPESEAAERSLTSNYFMLLAQRARLSAEQAGQTSFSPPPEFSGLSGQDRVLAQSALQMQLGEMRARRAAIVAQNSVLSQRERQLDEQQVGYLERRRSLSEQRRILRDELEGLREVAEKGFASKNRVRALERAEADLRGQEAAMAAEMARAGEGIGETRMQSLSILRTSQEEIAVDLRATESKIAEVMPKLIALREELERAQIRAPVSGQVVGLSIFTVGGVVSAGQTLMEIVPENPTLILQVQVSPPDADNVYPGQEAQVRFASVHDQTLPLISGRVKTISADSFTDENSGQSYFRAQIEVPPAELDRIQKLLGRGQLRPGLPVETMLSVRERTALQYILEPLTRSFRNSLHEQ